MDFHQWPFRLGYTMLYAKLIYSWCRGIMNSLYWVNPVICTSVLILISAVSVAYHSNFFCISCLLSPPVHVARWAHIRRFLSVTLDKNSPLDKNSYLWKYYSQESKTLPQYGAFIHASRKNTNYTLRNIFLLDGQGDHIVLLVLLCPTLSGDKSQPRPINPLFHKSECNNL